MKRRKTTPTGRTNPRILILCDGLTEKNYFTAIKQDPDYKRALAALSVDIVEAKKGEPLQIVEEAIKKQKKARQERNEYNHIWVVFDHDNRPSRLKAYKLAGASGICVAFSSIAYEYWYLLHFKQTAKVYLTAEPLIKELEKHIVNSELLTCSQNKSQSVSKTMSSSDPGKTVSVSLSRMHNS